MVKYMVKAFIFIDKWKAENGSVNCEIPPEINN